MRKESKFYRELPEHANDYVVDLVNRLRGVNSVTGTIYIIDLCNEAADHITALLKINELVKNPKKENEEIKRSFDKIEKVPWPVGGVKGADSVYMYVAGNTVADIKEPEEKEEKEDIVNHPSHYADSCSIECIDAMECMFGTDKLISFCFMNAFKYIWRFKNKNGLEDLKKARWYLDKSYELAHSEWATDAEVRSEDYLVLMEENYLKLDTLLNKAAFKGGFHGV